MQFLTSDADIAIAQADEKNAMDQLNAIISDQNRRTGSVGVPYQLAGQDLALKTALGEQQYAGIDSLMRRVQQFATTPASGPGLQTPVPNPVLSNTQIAGGLLSGLGTGIGAYGNNNALMDAIAAFGRGSGGGAGGTPTGSYGSGSYLGGQKSVFG